MIIRGQGLPSRSNNQSFPSENAQIFKVSFEVEIIDFKMVIRRLQFCERTEAVGTDCGDGFIKHLKIMQRGVRQNAC